jgi:cell division protein FtsZ
MIQFNLDPADSNAVTPPFSVSVIGIGGSGTNVIDKIALEGMSGADLVSLNCDARALNTSMAGTKVQLGKSLTQGLGCGGDPELGAEAAMASEEDIRQLLAGRSMVFLCVGLGGGTGSGAAPVIARMAREAGAFVIVFATLPFAFEGRRRSNQASLALQDLRKYANALITFENDRMGELVVPKKGVQEAFELADKIIGQSVRAVTSLVLQPGLIHIGMDDLVTALQNSDSRCLFGYGQAKGENRAVEALGQALKSPLLDRGQMQSGARNVLVHICGGNTLTLFEIETLMRELGKQVNENAQILFGAAVDPRLKESLSVTILTSLAKVAPVVEVAPALEVIAPPVVEVIPAVDSPAQAEIPVQATALAGAVTPPTGVTEADPTPAALAVPEPQPLTVVAPVAPPVTKLVAPVDAVDADLFPETVLLSPPEPEPTPQMIDIPPVVPVAVPVAEPVSVSMVLEEFFDPKVVIEVSSPPAVPVSHALPVALAEPEAIEEEVEAVFEESTLESDTEAPATELVPERLIRLERSSVPAAIVPEPVAPGRSRNETAAAARRFVLSDIIKREAKSAPAPVLPAMEYEAGEEIEMAPPPPVRPVLAPVSRRAPDYDHVAPIRPIPAGRNTPPPATPFTAAKPAAAAPAPVRPVPTQQQTFDERLQPATNGGRFDRVKPTVEEGEDLDVPTFLRRKR